MTFLVRKMQKVKLYVFCSLNMTSLIEISKLKLQSLVVTVHEHRNEFRKVYRTIIRPNLNNSNISTKYSYSSNIKNIGSVAKYMCVCVC